MRHWILGFLAWTYLTLAADAQAVGGPTPAQEALYTKTFQSAITAHQSGKYTEAIAGFSKCLELRPKDPSAAYNLACGYSLTKQLDPAFEMLGKAVEWGFGASNLDTDAIGMAEKADKDMEPLRADPRFAPLVAAMKASAKAVDEYANTPIFYIPERIAKAQEFAVLVVLHDLGSTKEALLASPWKSLADELELALVLPSGRIPLTAQAAEGMQWFASAQRYTQAAWKYERNVNAAVDAFKKEHKLDKNRVFIAGEGQGGMLAFNIAISAPGLYKGVLVFDSPLALALAQPKAANAVKMGFRGRVFANTTRLFGAPPEADLAKFIESIGQGLTKLNLTGVTLSTYVLDAEPAEQRRRLAREALSEWLAAAAPADPGAAK
jgi:predicted esterase